MDNVSIITGAGATVATDDVSGVHYQRVKLDMGGDGASLPVIGSVPVSETRSNSASRSQQLDVATDIVLLSANPSRIGASIFNDSSAVLYVGLGTTP